jgi:hypothetical protein
MVNRIGDGHKQFVWKMPDSRESGLPISVTLPHPFMDFPPANATVAPIIMRINPIWIMGSKGKGKPFDTGLIRPGMPTAIRNGFFEKLIRDILKERKRPNPAIKAPPRGDGTARKGEKKFMGIVKQRPAAKASHVSQDVPTPHAHMAMSHSNQLSVSLAAHISAMTFVRRI